MVLLIGPLQAQSVFACEMMDEVMYGDCCCLILRSGEDCTDGALNSKDQPCCKRSVEVSLDDEARLSSPIIKPFEVHSDEDPPTAIVASLDFLEPPHTCVAVHDSILLPDVRDSGSDIYLLTQRLRI